MQPKGNDEQESLLRSHWMYPCPCCGLNSGVAMRSRRFNGRGGMQAAAPLRTCTTDVQAQWWMLGPANGETTTTVVSARITRDVRA